MRSTTGQVLQNRYRIVSLLGQGGMGAIYRAWDTRLDVVVALKEMTAQPGLDPQTLAQLRQRFRQEAVVLARLHHPHLVWVTDFFEEGGNAYLVMNFVEGERLDQLIERQEPLSEAQVMEWVIELLGALAYCHSQGVVHRDIKPQNVIIRPNGEAVLVGFEVVKLWDPSHPSARAAIRAMGTPAYAPPELYGTQAGHTDPRSDIYSLGATIYHALTGQAPPTATMRIANPATFQPPRTLNPRLSPATEAAVLRATELAVGNRFAMAQEMAAALRGEMPVSVWPVAPGPQLTAVMPGTQPTPSTRRRRVLGWAWTLSGLAVLLLVVALARMVWLIGMGFTPTYFGSMSLVISGVLLLCTATVLALSRHSGLPISLLVQQGWRVFRVGLWYPDYYKQWQSRKPLVQLITLLELEELDTESVARALHALHVPASTDQIAAALDLAVHDGLIMPQKGRKYNWTEPALANVLRARVGPSGRVVLADQIRHDHPLFTNARRFLERAGFKLIAVKGADLYRCERPADLQRLLDKVVYARMMPDEVLDGDLTIAIREQLQRLGEKMSVVVVVTDQRPTDQGWAQIGILRMEGTTILPIESGLIYEGLVNGRERQVLRQEIERRLGAEYDPYDVRDPVSRAFSFFGRDVLVEDLLRRMREGRPIGIFGLRKLGKSSLLQALRDRAPFPVAAVNVQTVGNTALDEMYARIIRYWRQWAQVRSALNVDIPAITPNDPTGSFVAAALALLEQLRTHQVEARLGLLLDEVELVVPRSDGSGPDPQRYLTFLRATRGLIDEDGRLSLVVASLNPSINRINAWNSEQNPAFNLFQEIYLPPLTQEDCSQMVRNIGRQVGLVYSDESLEAIAVLSGGHPFLARQLCSLLYRQRDHQPGQIEADAISPAVEHFIYDDQTVTHLDAGVWQDAGSPTLWGEAQAHVNQALLLEMARADGPVAQDVLLDNNDADLRRAALINLERFHFIHQPEPGIYALRYGLLCTWLRRRKLGLE